MIQSANSRNDYIGNNSTDTYNYTYGIVNASDLYVVESNAATPPVSTLLIMGTDYTVTGAGTASGGTIVLSAGPLQNNYKLAILRVIPLTQLTDVRNQSQFFASIHEDVFDRLTTFSQMLEEQISRGVALPVALRRIDFDPTIPAAVTQGGMGIFLKIKQDGTGFELGAAGASGGAGLQIGLPTAGFYGDPVLGDPVNLQPTDILPDALNKLDILLANLAPTPPKPLSQKVMTIIGSYFALRSSVGTSDLCIDSATPTLTPGLTADLTGGFASATAGILSGFVDTADVGDITLTAADETGVTNGQLTIVGDFDPYAGQGFGKQGIYRAITAKIVAVALTVGLHTTQLKHTLTGSTPLLSFYVDDPGTVTIANKVLSSSGASSYKSGVPGIALGQNLHVTFDVGNAVNSHYNSTKIGQASSPQTSTVTYQPGSPPSSGATVSPIIDLPVAASAYSEDVTVTVNGYNSKGGTTSSTVNASVRVDTVGTETRNLSGTGQYPTTGYTTAMNSQTDVLTGNKELQFINGKYQYPALVNYSSKIPVGPNYSSLTSDTFNNNRWVTFAFTSITAASFVQFTFNGSSNFGASTLISGINIYVKVQGVTGWLDANAAYPGTGSPSADGDGALDISSSSATVKKVTFGTTPRTGTVYVRIGIPSGSTKSFTSIS